MVDDRQVEREKVAVSTGATKQERRGHRAMQPCAADVAQGEGVARADDNPVRAAREVLEPGTSVGRYQIVRLVGEGGMGTVYEALDARLHRRVALKILAAGLKGKRKAARRFAIEAQAAARLVHPNVVGIFDFDVDCEIPYMAMELLQGETLASAIARGPLAFPRMADVMLGVCAGVHAAHQAGIIHRDLKPSNIFLCLDWKGNETARVLDFGISKVGGISSSGLTETGDIVGTSQYLSPEQASGHRHVSENSDQYSLGVVMYECVTQRTPQQGEVIYTLLRNVTEGRHVRPSSLRPDLPVALESVIERAMQVRPDDRFPSVYELGRALFPFSSPEGQGQFASFYRRVDAGHRLPACAALSALSEAPGTVRLPREPARTWQRRSTRTSPRESQARRGPAAKTRADRPGRSARAAPVSPRPASVFRSLLLPIALGVLLAIAAFLFPRLLLGP